MGKRWQEKRMREKVNEGEEREKENVEKKEKYRMIER